MFAGAKSVTLFGSRASGCATLNSDWDLLCIGKGEPSFDPRMDLTWISEEDLPKWVGAELANHVAKFGHPLKGAIPFKEDFSRTEESVFNKEQQISGSVQGILRPRWVLTSPAIRADQLVRLRADFSRLELLKRKLSIPPSALLELPECVVWEGAQLRFSEFDLSAGPEEYDFADQCRFHLQTSV